MTAHIHSRTATDDRRSTVPSTTSTAPSTSPPRRPLPRWVAPFVVAAAICVAGVGVLVYDANNDLAPAPTPIEESAALGEGQRFQPGLPDGYWQPDSPTTASLAVRVGQIAQPGQPDGGVAQPATTEAAQHISVGTGQRLQPGMPDGHWQPAAPVAEAINIECGTSGPC
jgi:hypothetical protein